ERTFFAAVDSATRDMAGLNAISVITAGGEIRQGNGAMIGRRGLEVATDTVVRNPYLRAIATQQAAATGVLDLPSGRRVMVFDPAVSGDSTQVQAVIVGELDPGSVLRAALANRQDDPTSSFYALYGPAGAQITNVPLP